MAKNLEDASAAIKAAHEAIDHYTRLVKAGKNQMGLGGTDKKGASTHRKQLAVDKLSTFSDVSGRGRERVEVIPTGVNAYDEASGIGGIPKGKQVELFGNESGGKSYLAYKAIASCQRMGGVAALLDIEQAFTREWAETIGIDVDALIYENRAMPMENYLQLGTDLCFGGFIDLLVFDSTAAMIPLSELQGVSSDQNIAAQARILSVTVRKIVAAAAYTEGKGGKETAVIWINQIREKPGILFGNPETTPGGRALKFYCHQRIDVRRGKVNRVEIDEDKIPVSQVSYGTFVKNKLAVPYRKFQFEIKFDSTLTNPLVLLAQIACSKKIFKKYKGVYRMYEEDGDKKVETDTENFVDLSHWIHANGLAMDIVGRVTDIFAEELEDPPDFLAMIDGNTEPPLRLKDSPGGENKEEGKGE